MDVHHLFKGGADLAHLRGGVNGKNPVHPAEIQTVQAVGPRAQIVDKLAKVRAAGAPALSVVEGGGGAGGADARRNK